MEFILWRNCNDISHKHEEKVGSILRNKEQEVWCPILSAGKFESHESSNLCHMFQVISCSPSHLRPQAMGPEDHGLKPLKPWTKTNNSSLSISSHVSLSQQPQASLHIYGVQISIRDTKGWSKHIVSVVCRSWKKNGMSKSEMELLEVPVLK